ncbi:YhgE/Pip family protein [Gordonia sp. VNK21]|uniref:YhgE/Pip family protein n=1 Tax=Gordonia sp. VNK21 TaxID=3382483 RepID=UPI0038D3C8F8
MLAGMSLGTELKRYSRGTMPRIAIVTIVLLPLLYGAMYLWVFWNPFDEVNKLPVALVNEDRGAQSQGQELDAGDQVVSNLVASKELDLHRTDAGEAADGLASGKYYFTITIPEDFSSSIASAMSDDPHKAEIVFTYNDANSYLATVIGTTAAQRVTEALNENIGSQAVDQVLVGLQSAGKGLVTAADGAELLATNLATANEGAQKLASGSEELASNMVTARDGAQQLAAGNAQLADGITAATGPLMPLLSDVGSLDISDAELNDLGRLGTDLSGVLGALGAAGNQQSQAAQTLSGVIASLRGSGDPNQRALADALRPVLGVLQTQGLDPGTTARISSLQQQSQKLSTQLGNPQSPLRSTLTQLRSGGLAGEVNQLVSGAQQLKEGSATLASGMVQLTDGSVQLSDGAKELADGTPKLLAGSEQLADGLADGVKQIPDFGDTEQREKTAANLSQPVALNSVTKNAAPTFGSGFAPFFLPLALFIGAMIIWMLIKPLQSRPVITGLGGLRSVLSSYWPAVLLVLAQVTVMFLVAHFGVGLGAVHPLGLAAFMLLIGATFLALIQMFNAVFGVAVGRVVSLAFLMVQIVASGGIYPVPTTAKPAQILHPYDPMAYAVTGMRQMISGGVDSRFWISVGVLAGILAVSLLVSSLAARRNRQYTMEQLFPPIQV